MIFFQLYKKKQLVQLPTGNSFPRKRRLLILALHLKERICFLKEKIISLMYSPQEMGKLSLEFYPYTLICYSWNLPKS